MNNHNHNSSSISGRGRQQQQAQQITGSPMDAPADCTIACDEGHLTAHKLILCDHSKYLQDILSKFPTAEHPIIILTELNIMDIKILVNYMYTGELVITSDTSPTSLLRAAQILKIDSLTADDDDDDHAALDDEAEDEVADEENVSELMLEDEDDENELMMGDDDDLDNIADNNSITDSANSRLINSIKNIYSLNQFIDTASPPPSQHQQAPPLSAGSSLLGSNNTATSSSGSNGGSGGLSHHLGGHIANLASQQQQLLASHLDLQDLQDPNKLDKNNKIRCHLCNIGLSDVKCLYRHVLTRHLPEKWGYKCEFCEREFSRDDHLMRHYTTKHKNMEFNREKIRETRRLNREMAKNFHDQISTV